MFLKNFLKLNNNLKQNTIKYISTLAERGLLQEVFPDTAGLQIKNLLVASPQTFYAGFDPTADSLHVGNLLVIIGLLHCQRAGNQPIALLGGATGLIGDPSGRSAERNLIKYDVIEKNLICIEEQISNLFKNHEEIMWNKRNQTGNLKEVHIVNNADWYKNLNLIGFISETGRHFRMGTMLSKISVQSRLKSEQGMSFTEFTYQLFQAYDWLYLLQKYNCRFQIGGNDQLGNIMSGHELISRVENKNVFGYTLPIITNETGDKYGKSGGEAVWLDENKTSAFDFYQFFIRTPDSEVEKLLRFFTFIPLKQLKEIMYEHEKSTDLRIAQKCLAEEVTLLVHGESGLKRAECVTNTLYKGNLEDLSQLKGKDVEKNFSGCTISEILPHPGITVLEMAMKANCFQTESDAMRIITAGGFYINHKKAKNIAEVILPGIHILENNISLLRVGKKNYYIVKWLKIGEN